MPSVKAFTDRYLAALRPKDKCYDVLDASRRGLMLRVFPSGTKTFVFRFQRHFRPVRLTLGRYPALALSRAYELHGEYVKKLNRGEDPRDSEPGATAGSREGKPDAGPSTLTVGDLAEEFLKRYVYIERKRPEEAEEAEQTITANIVKPWKHRLAEEITRRDAVLLLDKIVDRGAPVMANRVAALLTQMFQFGVERGILEASPVVALPRPGWREKSRDRRLDEQEIRLFWRRLRTPRISPVVRLALKLVLVTAQRPGEIIGASRSEFDLEARIWTVPAEHSKNGRPHAVPLSPLAVTLLAHLRRHTGETEFVVPTRCWRHLGAVPLTVRALSQAIRDNEKHFGLPHFTPHDLRRTAASRMTALGVPRLHVEKILNHTIDDVAEIHDRHEYLEEKRAGLEKWGTAVERILKTGSSNVISIRSTSRSVG